MQVSTTAWHYRFLRAMECRRPSNLCSYFWMVVLHMALVVFFAGIALVVMALLVAPILAIWFEWFEQVMIVGYVIWLAILGVTWALYRHWRRTQMGYVKQPDGLALSWVKAKKDKVCPLIEYTS